MDEGDAFTVAISGGECMQDVLLVVAVAVMFVFGWFLVKKLDGFLKSSDRQQRQETDSDSCFLPVQGGAGSVSCGRSAAP